MSKFGLLLKEFCAEHQLEELLPDEKGIYLLLIDDMEIQCFEKFKRGYLTSQLATLPATADALPVFLKDLMNHALFRIKSHSCSLGLDQDSNIILFQQLEIDNMNFMEFNTTLEHYTNCLEEYSRFVRAETAQQAPADFMIITP